MCRPPDLFRFSRHHGFSAGRIINMDHWLHHLVHYNILLWASRHIRSSDVNLNITGRRIRDHYLFNIVEIICSFHSIRSYLRRSGIKDQWTMDDRVCGGNSKIKVVHQRGGELQVKPQDLPSTASLSV